MKKDFLIVILFSIFIILFSYKFVLATLNLTDNQEQTINYLTKNEKLNLNYTISESSHLIDVKNVINYMDITFLILLLICSLYITSNKNNLKKIKNLFFQSSIFLLSFIGTLLILSLTIFNKVFTLFHKIFFPQGNWRFPVNSLLIQTFPLNFFISTSIKIFSLSLLIAIFLMIGSLYIKHEIKISRN